MDKLQTLKDAVEARDDEILDYQINVDNYTRAIEKINTQHSDKPAIVEFGDHLVDLLEQHYTEQLKAIIMREVIADQLQEIEQS